MHKARYPMFSHAKLKVKRAQRHIAELNAEFIQFAHTDFYSLAIKPHPQFMGQQILELTTKNEIPAGIGLCLGDAVHNLWAAMDYIAFEIVGPAQADPTRVHFPKHETRDELIKSGPYRAIERINPRIALIIADQVKPYKAGNEPLWALSKVDNIDKHRLLVPTITVTALHGVTAMGNNTIMSDCSLQVSGGGKLEFPMGWGRNAEIYDYGQPAFDILFPPNSFFENKPVIPTLHQLTQLVLSAIDVIEDALKPPKAA